MAAGIERRLRRRRKKIPISYWYVRCMYVHRARCGAVAPRHFIFCLMGDIEELIDLSAWLCRPSQPLCEQLILEVCLELKLKQIPIFLRACGAPYEIDALWAARLDF